ncbi:hypothetical protein CEXT_34341 [Caerostris extrusa]|uniref:LAGLIDADG homing endonuclease n=1 Tax=Caerostris extrusa TaxID=172846 RepID=A0AAV4PHM6_CAEEX|nr:hypothetical protein CEXT_34341 [Caerostris extrusa]
MPKIKHRTLPFLKSRVTHYFSFTDENTDKTQSQRLPHSYQQRSFQNEVTTFSELYEDLQLQCHFKPSKNVYLRLGKGALRSRSYYKVDNRHEIMLFYTGGIFSGFLPYTQCEMITANTRWAETRLRRLA